MISTLSERAMGMKVNLVYLMFKVKPLWPLLDFLARQWWRVMMVCLVAISLHWQISVAMYCYVFLMMIYLIMVPNTLIPKAKANSHFFQKQEDEEEEEIEKLDL